MKTLLTKAAPEKWREVPGYEHLYLVSNRGRVLSLRTDRILTGSTMVTGYRFVRFSKNRKKTAHLIHRLVLSAFIPNPENKPCTNHKDMNPANNCVENLEWCTYKENIHHAINIRGVSYGVSRGEKNGSSKLTDAEVAEIKGRLALGESTKKIAEDYQVTETNIFYIKKGTTWGHIKTPTI